MTDNINLPPLPEWMCDFQIPADDQDDSDFNWLDWRMKEYARAAVLANMEGRQQWRPIETAPDDQEVLLGWTEWDGAWKAEVGMASWGWRTDRVSNVSRHGRATHWMPLPAPPADAQRAKGDGDA